MARFLTLLLIVWLARSPLAAACSCVRADYTLAPADGEQEVPPESLIWVGSGHLGFRGLTPDMSPANIVLRDDVGNEVPGGETRIFTRERDGRPAFFVQIFRPARRLEPGRTYAASAGGIVVTTFTVAEALMRSTRPRVPQIVDENQVGGAGGSCGPYVGAGLKFDVPAQFILGETVGSTSLDVDALTGDVSAFATDGLYYGWGRCSSNWHNPSPWKATEIRFGAFDITGRFSGWSEPRRLQLSFLAWAQSTGWLQPDTMLVVIVPLLVVIAIVCLAIGGMRRSSRQ